jgi:hypothetical protein
MASGGVKEPPSRREVETGGQERVLTLPPSANSRFAEWRFA